MLGSHRWRVGFGASLGAILMATVGQAVGAAPPTPADPPGIDSRVLASAPAGPVLVSGTLRDARGRAAAGKVAALAWPDEAFLVQHADGTPFTTPTVGWGRAGNNGRFNLQINQALLPAGYVAASGQVNLDIVGWTSSSVGVWSASTWLGDPVGGLGPVGPAKAAAVSHSPQIPDIVVDASQALSAPSTGVSFGTPVHATPVGCIPWWVDIGNSKYPTQQMGETLPWPSQRMPAKFKITNSESMSLGIASSFNGTYGSWSVAGTQSVTNSVTHDFPYSTADLGYYTTDRYDEYQDQHHFCETWMPQYYYRDIQNTGSGWSSGVAYPAWCCTYLAYESPQVWSRNSSNSYILSTGVGFSSVLGINLSVTESWSTNFEVFYNFTSAGWMCGNNNSPSVSSRVENC